MKRRLGAITVLLVVAMSVGGSALCGPVVKKTTTITIVACIDSDDQLIVQGGTLEWRNVSGDPVGVPRVECPSNATTISSFEGRNPPSRPISWIPLYNGAGADSDSGAISSMSPTFDPGLPARDMTLSVSVGGHGAAAVKQVPVLENGYQFVLQVVNLNQNAAMLTVTIVATEK